MADAVKYHSVLHLQANSDTSDTVMTQSQSEAGIGLEFGSEQSYQVSEEGNEIGLGLNLCVAPTHTICRFIL